MGMGTWGSWMRLKFDLWYKLLPTLHRFLLLSRLMRTNELQFWPCFHCLGSILLIRLPWNIAVNCRMVVFWNSNPDFRNVYCWSSVISSFCCFVKLCSPYLKNSDRNFVNNNKRFEKLHHNKSSFKRNAKSKCFFNTCADLGYYQCNNLLSYLRNHALTLRSWSLSVRNYQ